MKDALKFIKSASASFLFAVLAITLGVFLTEAAVFLRIVSHEIKKEVKESFRLNVVINDTLNSGDISALEGKLRSFEQVSNTEYISKQSAAEKFIAQTGEDFRDVLDENPLPASFLLSVKPEIESQRSFDSLAGAIKMLPGIEEVDFSQNQYNEFLRFAGQFEKYLYSIMILLIVSAVYIIYSTLRLIMMMRSEEIEIMKLVGSTLSRIRKPALYYGLIIGLAGGFLSLGLWELLRSIGKTYIGIQFSEFSIHFLKIYPYAALGPVLGFLGSVLSVRKLTLNF